MDHALPSSPTAAMKALLKGFSIEVTPGDVKAIDAARQLLPAGTEAFIASLPNGTPDQMISAAARLRATGMTPVPHIAARAISSEAALDALLAQLTRDAGVECVLLVAGDRDVPAGPYDSSLQLIQSGMLERHGVRSIRISCYPEGHPRIASAQLEQARLAKLAAARRAGLDVTFVSQFCFEPAPIVNLAHRMRADGSGVPYRVGLAGAANSATLLKYAMMCGVGASMRALRERQTLAKNMLRGPATEDLIESLAIARARDADAGIDGLHFFTFGALAKTADMISAILARPD